MIIQGAARGFKGASGSSLPTFVLSLEGSNATGSLGGDVTAWPDASPQNITLTPYSYSSTFPTRSASGRSVSFPAVWSEQFKNDSGNKLSNTGIVGNNQAASGLALVKPNVVTGGTIVSIGGGGAEWGFDFASGYLRFFVYSGSTSETKSTLNVSAGNWLICWFIYTGTTGRIGCDDLSDTGANGSMSKNISAAVGGNAGVGATYATGGRLDGALGGLWLSNFAWSTPQLSSVYTYADALRSTMP